MRSLASWPERFTVLDAVLARAVAARSARTSAVPAEVVEAFRLLVASGGSADIAGVARTVGWSRRHLSERFRQEVGMAPKATARLVRFDLARGLLSTGRWRGGWPRWRPTRATPTRRTSPASSMTWLASRPPHGWHEELPYVQDLDPRAGAG